MDGTDRTDGSDPNDGSERGNRESPGRVTPADLTAESPFTLPGFFAALSDGRVLGGRCSACEEAFIPPRPACYACGSREIAVEEQSKEGEIVTYTEVGRPAPAFAADAPLTIAVVELGSGARLTGRVDATYDEVEIGTGVELTVRELTEREREFALDHETEWPLHVFELA